MSPIFVIADDLSGAAEIAGIAATRGLTAAVVRHTDCSVAAEVTAIDADSRSSPATLAALQMRIIAGHVSRYENPRIFKKVDSLLRGQPRAEIESLMHSCSYERTLLLPANPSRGRTISGGQYFVNGIPVNETVFADDPEFPRAPAEISALIAPGLLPIQNICWPAALPSRGIIVPDTEFTADVKNWASTVDASILPAGAADFFDAMLNRWCGPDAKRQPSISPPLPLPALLVCGSHAAWQSRKSECAAAQVPIIETGFPSTGSGTRMDNFVAVSRVFQSHDCLALASGQARIPPNERVTRLQNLAHTAALVVRNERPATLLLEGGATAAAVVSQLGWKRFTVQPTAFSGVGFLKPIEGPSAPLLVIKPGSYPWPLKIWESFCG